MKPVFDWPCRECQKHTPICHGKCREYLEAKAAHKKATEQEKARNILLSDYISASVEKTRGSNGGLVGTYRPKGRR